MRSTTACMVLARKLPAARKQIAADLRTNGLTRKRVTAAGLRMLDAGLFRSGGEEYEAEHGSHGVATLLRSHVTVSGEDVTFEFPAKSGVTREAVMTDQLLARIVLSLKRSGYPGERLLAYRDTSGWHELRSSDLNVAFKELVGEEYTVKDLRTWAATVTAAVALARTGPVDSERELKRAEKDAMKVVSEHLGNTPAVARRLVRRPSGPRRVRRRPHHRAQPLPLDQGGPQPSRARRPACRSATGTPSSAR